MQKQESSLSASARRKLALRPGKLPKLMAVLFVLVFAVTLISVVQAGTILARPPLPDQREWLKFVQKKGKL